MIGAAISVGPVVAFAYIGLAARKWGIRRFGQTVTGFIEDAVIFGSGLAIAYPTLVARRS